MVIMNNNKFKEMGAYLIQIGLYFTTKDDSTFDDNQIHNNIMNYLLQSYLYLTNYKSNYKLGTMEIQNQEDNINSDKYLTKKEVIKEYYPLLTDYGLSQAIHTKNLPYHKRGAKYFFRKSEIDEWINSNNKDVSKKTYKQTQKFV